MPAPVSANALSSRAPRKVHSSASTSTTSGVIPAARIAPNEAGKVKAGSRTCPVRPVASRAADNPAVALQQVTHVSSGAPNFFKSPASNRRARGPKFEYQPFLSISSSNGK